MVVLFRIVMVSVPAICFVVWLISFIQWVDDTWFHLPKIKFASFKKFYKINPYRWMLFSGKVECKINGCTDVEKFRFGYIDYLKYHHWRKQQEKTKNQEYHNRSMERMMAAVKSDITEQEAKAKKMQEDLTKIFESDGMDLLKFIEEYKKRYGKD